MKQLYLLILAIGLLVAPLQAQSNNNQALQALEEMTRRLINHHLQVPTDLNAATRWSKAIRSDGFFADLDYTTRHEGTYYPVGTHLKRLVILAKAYRKTGSKHHASTHLRKQIVAGLEYWRKAAPSSKNWWFNEIGAPRDYMVALLLIKGEIDSKLTLQLATYLRDCTGNKGHKGKNRTWVSDITLHKGCIEDDIELVSTAFASIASTITVVERQGEEGIKIDGSFHQHRPQLYSGGYGLSYVDDIAHYLQLVQHTPFDVYFTTQQRNTFAHFLLEGHRILGYRTAFDFGAVGRNISRPNNTSNISAQTLQRMEQLEQDNPQRAAQYTAWRKHLAGGKFPAVGNKHFWKSDIMVQHGSHHYLSAKILSARTNGTEMLNNENLNGYNLPLGATNIMTTGKEYTNIFPLWDWTGVPGTTAIQHPDSSRLEGYHFGHNNFGGGVSNGHNGLIAYQHHYKGVKAHKAYFFLNNALVCLGAGITSAAPHSVATTVNQCYYNGTLTASQNNSTITYQANASVKSPAWVHHDGVGYLFLNGNNISVTTQTKTGTWSSINTSGSDTLLKANLLDLRINHGKQPTNQTYAYVVVPSQSTQEFGHIVATQPYQIVKNTPTVQAVKCGQSYAAVFYQPSSLMLEAGLHLIIHQPIILYLEKQSEGYTLWAADPLHTQRQATLMINNCEVNINFPTGSHVGSTTAPITVSSLQPNALQCEYLTNPLGMDVLLPRLSWKMGTITTNRAQAQTAYRVLVASSQTALDKGKGDLWDSGIVNSPETVNIVYQGKSLTAGQRCYWKVQLCNEQGKWSAWSNQAHWQVGLQPTDWKSQWIGSAQMEAQSLGGKRINNQMHDPWMRKNFALKEVPSEAVIYVASIGYHELYVNGKRVGDAVLAPSATDHKTRARYVTYDLAGYLNPGNNVLALWLGTSWAIFPAYQQTDRPAIPLVRVQADITLPSNGKKIQLLSDASWKVHASPNMLLGYWEAHHFEGEYYDANLEIEEWNCANFDDSTWQQAKVYHPNLNISADRTEPNRLMEPIYPRSVQEVEPGVYRIDMGVNYAGWFEMEVEGVPGDSILFQFSEREKDACSYGIHSVYKVSTKQQGKSIFSNRFNYMTGRWILVSGLTRKPSLNQIRGTMIRPDYRRSGNFNCDISLLNSIYRTTMWTFENLSLGNYVVDCPHRERCGYGGDALATTRMALGNYQMPAFYTKWMEDWRDVQDTEGNVPYTAPTRIGGGGPSWSGFCITLPWEVYTQYGDTRILAESFDTIKRWLAFVETKSDKDMLVRWGGKWGFLGDWLWPDAWTERSKMEKQGKALGDTPETLFFNNCHWVYSLETAANIANVLGHNAIATAYRLRAAQVRKAIHATFFNKHDNSYVNGLPAYLAMAITINLPPKHLQQKVWKRLEQEILVNRKGHFWGGITAGSFLMHTLLDNHRNDLIGQMVIKEEFPSWGNMVKKGNGTLFEDWECRGSALHSSFLYIGSWFIEALGGIQRPAPGKPNHFVIEPWIAPNGPKQVETHYNSIFGNVVSNWKTEADTLTIDVTVPANTTATLKLSCVEDSSIRESGELCSQAEGISLAPKAKNKRVLELKSGTYRFTARIKR